MIWPFKRKPKVVRDLRAPTSICAGDKVECIWSNWKGGDLHSYDPQVGDVLTVIAVEDAVHRLGIRRIWLRLKGCPGSSYAADHFRKLVEQDDAATIARIKKLPVKQPVSA